MSDRDLDAAIANEPSTAELSAQIDALKTDIAGLTEIITALGKAKGASIVEAAKEEAYYLKARGEDKVAELQDRARSLTAQAEEAVRANPSTALGVAAGAGFLFGVILSRR